MVWIIVVAVIAVILLWFFATANSLNKLKVNGEKAFADCDVFLTKRYDLIPNLVSTVKGYAKHEKETLEAVIAARNTAVSAESINDKVNADNKLTETISKLFALTESYPDLKANENFMGLQKELSDIETEISGARRYYNAAVGKYNYKIVSIPACIVASILKFEKMSMFEASKEQRENVKVDFEN